MEASGAFPGHTPHSLAPVFTLLWHGFHRLEALGSTAFLRVTDDLHWGVVCQLSSSGSYLWCQVMFFPSFWQKSSSSVYYTIRLPWEDGYWKPFHYLAFVFPFSFLKQILLDCHGLLHYYIQDQLLGLILIDLSSCRINLAFSRY